LVLGKMEEDSSKVFFKDQEIMVLGLQERAIRWIGLSQGSKCLKLGFWLVWIWNFVMLQELD